VFSIDTGMCAVWGARYLSAARGRRILGSFNHGRWPMRCRKRLGRNSPTHAASVLPVRRRRAGHADGELLTVTQYQLPIKIILFNNHRLGMVQLEMEAAGLPHYGCELKNPNFATLAQAVGMMGLRVEDPAEVRPALERALATSGPVLVDLVTDPNVLSMPPKATIEQAMGSPWP